MQSDKFGFDATQIGISFDSSPDGFCTWSRWSPSGPGRAARSIDTLPLLQKPAVAPAEQVSTAGTG